MSLKIGQVKKWPSPIIKFHSNFESPIQSEYAGKFLGQSDDTSHFYRTRKVDDGFLGVKSSSWNYFPSFTKKRPFDLKIAQNVKKRVLYKILSDSKSSRGALGCYRWKSEFWSQTLSIFFDHVPYIPYLDGTWKVDTDPQFNII